MGTAGVRTRPRPVLPRGCLLDTGTQHCEHPSPDTPAPNGTESFPKAAQDTGLDGFVPKLRSQRQAGAAYAGRGTARRTAGTRQTPILGRLLTPRHREQRQGCTRGQHGAKCPGHTWLCPPPCPSACTAAGEANAGAPEAACSPHT